MKRFKKPPQGSKKSTAYTVILILLAAATLFLGNRVATRNVSMFSSGEREEYYIAQADLILDTEVTRIPLGDTVSESTRTTFYATILRGARRGEVVIATQDVDTYSFGARSVVRVGDKIILRNIYDGYVMTSAYRSDILIIFGVVFAVLLVVFGGLRGVTSLFSLALSLCSVFLFLVPALLSGFNVYLCALAVCLFNILVSPLLVAGFNKKAAAAILGCAGGVAISAGLAVLLDRLLRLTGVINEEMMYIAYLDVGRSINLNGLMFATVLIGALGALIDVSVSIASPVVELHEQKPMRFRELVASAFNIGRDIMGAQTATLVLAYIGCSLPMVLVLVYFQNSLTEMINLEMIAVDLMEALVGAFAILFTIPATALTTSILCTKKGAHNEN